MNMPFVKRNNVVNLTEEEMKIFNIVVKKNDTLRASKPKVGDRLGGRAAYVWRMVAFFVSPKSAHSCMPVCANFDLKDEDWTNRREVEKELDVLVDKIVNAVDKRNWAGISRWRALGY